MSHVATKSWYKITIGGPNQTHGELFVGSFSKMSAFANLQDIVTDGLDGGELLQAVLATAITNQCKHQSLLPNFEQDFDPQLTSQIYQSDDLITDVVDDDSQQGLALTLTNGILDTRVEFVIDKAGESFTALNQQFLDHITGISYFGKLN